MTRLKIDGTPVAVVPATPDPDMLQDGHDAAKAVRAGGVGGMTIDAQLRLQCAREAAAYDAMLVAADPALTEAVVQMRRVLAKIYHDWDGEPEDMLDAALGYIRSAPPEVQTPVRAADAGSAPCLEARATLAEIIADTPPPSPR